MGTTIDRPLDNRPKRKHRDRTELVAQVERLFLHGANLQQIGRELDICTGSGAALYTALWRSQRLDLWRALAPGQPDRERVRLRAEIMLAAIPAEPDDVIDERRQELLAEVYGDEDIAPAGRRVRGPGGVVRWVA